MRRQYEICKVKEGVFTAPVTWAKTWEELEDINGYCVDVDSKIIELNSFRTIPKNKNIFATEEQVEQYGIVAAQLSQLVAQLNGEPNWKPEKGELYYCIDVVYGELWACQGQNRLSHFPFKTQWAADFSLKYHKDLWRKFWGI